MGIFGQLGALFWKNILIRRRHPTYIVLEVVWPVVLFVVLVLMRLGSPPDHRETCEYQDRDLPSAGLMPFLQSSVCTLNNNCSTKDWVKEKAETQQRFQALIQDLNPLISKETTVEAFKALPTVTKVLDNIKDVAGSSTVEEMDEKLLLKNMFRDPDKVVTILSDKYRILDMLIAEALLDASLNPIAFVTSIGSVDLKKIVCDPNELERFIILSDKNNRYMVNKYSVSNSLCQIPDHMISDIINELIHQLDVANIVRLGKDLANMTGSVDVALLMSDLADLMDMYMRSSNLLGMIDAMPDLMFIPQFMREFSKLVPLLDDMMNINMEQISALLDFVGPMISSFTDDKKMVDTLQGMINSTQEILSSMDLSMDFDTLMKELPNLINSTNVLESSSKALGFPLASPPVNEVNKFMDMMMNGEFKMEDLTTMSWNDTLDYMEVMMRSILGNDSTDLMMAMGTNMMEMMTEYTTYTNNVEEDLKGVVSSSDSVVESLNTLYALGEHVAGSFLTEMLTLDNVYGLMKQEISTLDVCENVMRLTYKPYPDIDTEPIVASVCTSEAAQVVDQVFVKNNYTELTIKVYLLFDWWSSDDDVKLTYK